MTTTPESKALADMQNMDDGFWPWDTDRAIENSEHPLAWCFYCKTWQPSERLVTTYVLADLAPTLHGSIREALRFPIGPALECRDHLLPMYTTNRKGLWRNDDGRALCSYILTADELAELRSVDWL